MTEADNHATTPHPDAAVLMLARELHALDAQSLRLADEADALLLTDPAREAALSSACQALSEVHRILRRELALIPAVMPDGVQAKARLLWEQANVRSDDGCPGKERELAWSLARDLLGGEGTSAGAAGG